MVSVWMVWKFHPDLLLWYSTLFRDLEWISGVKLYLQRRVRTMYVVLPLVAPSPRLF